MSNQTNINYSIQEFNDLSNHQLYSVLKLRTDVFVVEQECAYPELDDKDQEATHVVGVITEKIVVAYARILRPKGEQPPAIGRIVVSPSHRGIGAGHEIMRFCLKYLERTYGSVLSKLSAQSHLTRFYEEHGYKVISDEYPWDGIPHVDMLLDPVTGSV